MDKVEYLENLSKLKFSEEERTLFETEFDSIIEFVDEISGLEIPEGLDTDETIALSELREDEEKPSLTREAVLMNAPKQKDGCYVTPLVVE